MTAPVEFPGGRIFIFPSVPTLAFKIPEGRGPGVTSTVFTSNFNSLVIGSFWMDAWHSVGGIENSIEPPS